MMVFPVLDVFEILLPVSPPEDFGGITGLQHNPRLTGRKVRKMNPFARVADEVMRL
jgi:hypothetical protein